MKKRLGTSFMGIPLWMITGTALFILFSAVYDFIVLDRSFTRYTLIASALIIIVISVGMKFTSMKFISSQARKQMGG